MAPFLIPPTTDLALLSYFQLRWETFCVATCGKGKGWRLPAPTSQCFTSQSLKALPLLEGVLRDSRIKRFYFFKCGFGGWGWSWEGKCLIQKCTASERQNPHIFWVQCSSHMLNGQCQCVHSHTFHRHTDCTSKLHIHKYELTCVYM